MPHSEENDMGCVGDLGPEKVLRPQTLNPKLSVSVSIQETVV